MSTSGTGASLEKSFDNSVKSIRTSLQALGPLSSSSSIQSVPPLPEGLADILTALLQTIRHTTTALALSFKPPITVPAAIQQLGKISDEYARITSCVVGAAFHGTYSVLVDEWREGVESIGTELQRLLAILKEPRTDASGKGDDVYLAHTGIVWAAIDRMKGFSKTENQAVVKRWEGEKETVKDAWTEFKEFLEDQEGDEEEEEEDDFIYGDEILDELGALEKAMAGGTMSTEERSRAEAAKTLLGLHQLLHASIPRFLPCLASAKSEPTYRQLVDASTSIVASFDTAISTMYPEQDESEISASLRDLEDESRNTIRLLQARLAKLDTQTEREQLRSFLKKWLERLDKESASWQERRLSLTTLSSALP